MSVCEWAGQRGKLRGGVTLWKRRPARQVCRKKGKIPRSARKINRASRRCEIPVAAEASRKDSKSKKGRGAFCLGRSFFEKGAEKDIGRRGKTGAVRGVVLGKGLPCRYGGKKAWKESEREAYEKGGNGTPHSLNTTGLAPKVCLLLTLHGRGRRKDRTKEGVRVSRPVFLGG